MTGWLDSVPGPLAGAVCVNDERGAVEAQRDVTVQLLLAPNSAPLGDRMVRIDEQRLFNHARAIVPPPARRPGPRGLPCKGAEGGC